MTRNLFEGKNVLVVGGTIIFYIAAIKSVIYFFNSNLEILFRLVLDTQNLYIFNFHFRVL